MRIERALAEFRAPDEHAAGQRAWQTVRLAHADRGAIARGARLRRRSLSAGLAAAGLAAAVLSPAGATVSRLLTRALGIDHPRGTLALPAPGRMLVSGRGGTWTIASDGTRRELGTWREAAWSPHGRYVAVTSNHGLAVVNGAGALQWELARPGVTDVRWFTPSGYRLAYISRRELRVVAGDGTGDQLLASNVARVPPAWQPGRAYDLAYVTVRRRLVVRDAQTGATLWTARVPTAVRALSWSGDGRRLVALTAREVLGYDAHGRLMTKVPAPGSGVIRASALSPDGRTLALLTTSGGQSTAVLQPVGRDGAAPRRLLTGEGLAQVVWSPNGRWVLITWPAADQWVFVRAVGAPRIIAVSRISRQLSGGRKKSFPRVAGWCCTAPEA